MLILVPKPFDPSSVLEISYSIINFFKKKSIWKAELQSGLGGGERERQTDLPSAGLLSKCYSGSARAYQSQEFDPVSCLGVESKHMGYLLLFSRHIRGELDEKVKQLQLVLAPM